MLIGVVLIVYILVQIDVRNFIQMIQGVALLQLLPVFSVYLVFAFLSTMRWKILLDYQDFKIDFYTLFKYYLISLLVGQALPTTVGGDVVRVAYLRERRIDAFAVVVMDRLIGFLGLFIFALLVSLIIYPLRQELFFLKFIVIGISVILALLFISFSQRMFNFFSSLFARIRIFGIGEKISNIYGIISRFRRARKELVVGIFFSFLIQATLAIGPYLVHLALPINHINPGYFLLCIPLINIVAMIPISPGAIGVRESGFVFFFSEFGIPPAGAFTLSLLTKTIEVIIYLVGGGFYYFRKK